MEIPSVNSVEMYEFVDQWLEDINAVTGEKRTAEEAGLQDETFAPAQRIRRGSLPFPQTLVEQTQATAILPAATGRKTKKTPRKPVGFVVYGASALVFVISSYDCDSIGV